MRLSQWSLVLLAVSAPLLVAWRNTPRAIVQVTVNARCAGPNNTEVTVSPWNVRLRQGDEVEWVLAANANSNNVTITPKETSDWPFATRGPFNGAKGNPARANGMRGNGRGTYKYNIALVCQSGQNAPDSVIVDPDIIVD
jgi:hypothetical protein